MSAADMGLPFAQGYMNKVWPRTSILWKRLVIWRPVGVLKVTTSPNFLLATMTL